MEPHFPTLSPGALDESSGEVNISEQQQTLQPLSCPHSHFHDYQGYSFGYEMPYSPLMTPPVVLAIPQVVPFPHYFIPPGALSPFQAHLSVQTADLASGVVPFYCLPYAFDPSVALPQPSSGTFVPQENGVASPPAVVKEEPLPSTLSLYDSNTSVSSNTSSGIYSGIHSVSPPSTEGPPKLPSTPSSPPGLSRNRNPSSNDPPRSTDTSQSTAPQSPRPQTIAYIPRKRPLIPDLLYIPRLTGQPNFKEWDELIQTLLIQMRLYDHIYSSKQKPHIHGITPSYPPAVHPTSSKEEKQRSADWWANDACVKMILSMRLSKTIMQVALAWEGGDTAREMYKLLWRMYGPPSSRREERLSGVEKREVRG